MFTEQELQEISSKLTDKAYDLLLNIPHRPEYYEACLPQHDLDAKIIAYFKENPDATYKDAELQTRLKHNQAVITYRNNQRRYQEEIDIQYNAMLKEIEQAYKLENDPLFAVMKDLVEKEMIYKVELPSLVNRFHEVIKSFNDFRAKYKCVPKEG